MELSMAADFECKILSNERQWSANDFGVVNVGIE